MDIKKLKMNTNKLKKLNLVKLQNIEQLIGIGIEITNYKLATVNYNKEKFERCSIPYLKGWTDFLDIVKEEIKGNSRSNHPELLEKNMRII